MPQLPPITRALLLICTALFCAQMLFGDWIEVWFALWPLGSGHFLPWQVLSYAFLHGDMGHLFFNMLGLWMFGAEIEMLFGRKRYMQYLAASALSGALIQLLISPLIMPIGATIGASGALFGLLLAFGTLFPDRIIMPLFPPIPMKAKYFVMVFGALELFFGMTSMRGGVAHFAHLGGMLGGWLMLRYWRGLPPFPPRRR
jgi:membrane associated rhomboid family serine protease